jgi:phosphatidylserine decarboxylase
LFAREGQPFLLIALVIAISATGLAFAMSFFWIIAALAWLFVLFVLQFFRDPARTIPEDPLAVVSPADGRVIKVEKAHDPYLDREALRISVFMNVFNVHSNRAPVDGNIKAVWYHPGQFFNAALDKAAEANERNALHIVTLSGEDVTCVQIAGLVARRILCYVGVSDALARGQRYGFIRFGSRVDLYLPTSATPNVTVGQKVKATESVLATLHS